jgi:predicted amidohydrolase
MFRANNVHDTRRKLHEQSRKDLYAVIAIEMQRCQKAPDLKELSALRKSITPGRIAGLSREHQDTLRAIHSKRPSQSDCPSVSTAGLQPGHDNDRIDRTSNSPQDFEVHLAGIGSIDRRVIG